MILESERLRPSFCPNATTGRDERRGIACHEAGHAVVLHAYNVPVEAVWVVYSEEKKDWYGGHPKALARPAVREPRAVFGQRGVSRSAINAGMDKSHADQIQIEVATRRRRDGGPERQRNMAVAL